MFKTLDAFAFDIQPGLDGDVVLTGLRPRRRHGGRRICRPRWEWPGCRHDPRVARHGGHAPRECVTGMTLVLQLSGRLTFDQPGLSERTPRTPLSCQSAKQTNASRISA